jgi:integrase
MPKLVLTAQFVRGINPPAAGIAEYWDTITPGLCLRVMPSGRATWTYRYRPKAALGYKRIGLGTVDDLSLSDARKKASGYRLGVLDGADPMGERQAAKAAEEAAREAEANAPTFADLAERYLAYAKSRKSSWTNDKGYLARPIAAWGSRAPASITRLDVIRLLDKIAETAPVSANRTQSVLVTCLNWAVEGAELETNPIAGLRKRAKEESKERYLSDREVAFLWKHLDESREVTRDVADALRFVLVTGARPGMVTGATTGMLVDLDNPSEARWEVPGWLMKSRRPHMVPLSGLALELIESAAKRRQGEPDLDSGLFSSKYGSRETIARHSLSQAMKRLIEGLKAEGPDRQVIESLKANPPTPHDLRRTCATGMSRLGVPKEDRMGVLAHIASDVHGAVYDMHDRAREKRAALDLWAAHLSKLIGRPVKSADVITLPRRA